MLMSYYEELFDKLEKAQFVRDGYNFLRIIKDKLIEVSFLSGCTIYVSIVNGDNTEYVAFVAVQNMNEFNTILNILILGASLE